jgi:hypothetical protein
VTDPSDGNKAFNFDFSPLCSSTDYVTQDDQGHTYYANVCKEAAQQCLPADCDNYPYCVPWQNTYMYGNAIQMWGQTPPAQPMDPSLNCHPYSQPTTNVPCTKACQVLGVGAPSWSLSNPADPSNSDVIGTWRGVPPTPQDPFYCPNDPVTGQPQARQVHFIFQCAAGVTGQIVHAIQNVTEACHYRLYFKTQQACISTGMSGGSAFLLFVFVTSTLYFVGGGLFNYLTKGAFEILHKTFWLGLPAQVLDGVYFLRDVVTGTPRGATFNAVSTEDAGSAGFSASNVSYQDDQELAGGDGNAAAAAYADL